MNAKARNLVSASADGVLGEYQHAFELGQDEEFVILYGPNGVGKTKFLEIIDALSRLQGFTLSTMPFSHARLTYSDGSVLSATREDAHPSNTDAEIEFSDREALNQDAAIVIFSLNQPGEPQVSWEHKDEDFSIQMRKLGRYAQITDVLWQDSTDGEIVHIEDLKSRYQGRRNSKKRAQSAAPEVANDFVETVPSFLIETQRLRTQLHATLDARRNFRMHMDERPTGSRITDQAKTIRTLLNEAQTEHSRITQQLDRTFPNRVLGAATKNQGLNQESIRSQYNTQNEFRSRLGKIASISLDDALSLPPGSLDNWALTLLNQYLEDTEKKFAPFVVLLEKIELLERTVNDHLLKKKLHVTDGDGLAVTHADTGQSIALETLSSGEQHEIILMIDLLFNVPDGALVLVDEPEISLHVAWQIAFIPDVRRIAKLAGFRFVVATHSPQIINDQWNRAVRLGPAELSF